VIIATAGASADADTAQRAKTMHSARARARIFFMCAFSSIYKFGIGMQCFSAPYLLYLLQKGKSRKIYDENKRGRDRNF
jgi:hypothetical protein